MKVKRLTSLLLALAMLFGLTVTCSLTVSAESALVMSDEGIEMIKSFEGFAEKPYWDVNQYTVGYGTYCPDSKYEEYKENGIPEEEAEALLREHVAKYETAVNGFSNKYNRPLTQNEFDALVCFSYNLGSGWIYSSSSNFRRTMIDPESSDAEIIYWFAAHCSAGGSVLSGLVRRRAAEVNLFLNGVYSTARPANYKYIKYDANGGELTSRLNMYDINTTDRVDQIPTYEGYTFDGWFTAAEGGTQVTVLDESTHGTTLYAHWTANEGTEVPDEETEEDTNTEQEVSLTVTVTSGSVNLRKGPGTNYTTVGSASKGDVYNISKIAVVGDLTWGYYGSGWICLNYTSYSNPIEEEETPEPEEPATVTGTVKVNTYLSIRTGAGASYESVGKLYNGDKVEILEQKVVGATTWGRIEQGWISLTYVVLDDETTEETPKTEETPAPEETPDEEQTPETEKTPEEEETTEITGTITASSLLVRSGPGSDYEAIGSVKKGASVTITQQQTVGNTTWGKISSGWISMTYVKLDTAEEETPVPEETPEEETPEEDTTTEVTGTITASSLLIRTGPGTSYEAAGSYKKGASVTITEQKTVGSTTWGKTSKGWISMTYVKLNTTSGSTNTGSSSGSTSSGSTSSGSSSASGVTGTVTTSSLRVRSGPGSSYSVTGYVYNGDKVTITETKVVGSTTWGKTSKGWISLDYVKVDGSLEDVADIRTVTTSCLKIRKSASTGASVVDYLYKGDKVKILETKTVKGTEWGRIATGWICLDYVK